ncbi:hypothetical protein D3C84_675710 [compost metagenome]
MGQIHLIEQHQAHGVFHGRLTHLYQQAQQWLGIKTVVQGIEEPEQRLRTVPGRLHRQAHEMNATKMRIQLGQLRLACATRPGQDGQG